MQAQATRTLNGNISKLAGGLLLTAVLAAGAIGITTVGELDLHRSSSDTAAVSAPVAERHFATSFGEGLIQGEANITVEHVSTGRQIAAPQGEGYPLTGEIREIVAQPAGLISQARQFAAPQGEGYPLIELEQSAQALNPLGEGLMTGRGR